MAGILFILLLILGVAILVGLDMSRQRRERDEQLIRDMAEAIQRKEREALVTSFMHIDQ